MLKHILFQPVACKHNGKAMLMDSNVILLEYLTVRSTHMAKVGDIESIA